MRRLLFIIVLALTLSNAYAEDFVVSAFKLAGNDLSGSVHMRTDVYGHPCALLKVQCVANVKVEGNTVGDIEYHGTEKWIYIQEKTSNVKVTCSNGQRFDLEFSQYQLDPAVGKMTYVLTLSEANSPEIINQAEKYYQQGLSLLRDTINKNIKFSDVLFCLKEAADMGHTKAQYELGELLINYGDVRQGFKWVKQAADTGLPSAEFLLGGCFLKGNGTTKDEKQGILWVRKSADDGSLEAQSFIGGCYRYGFTGYPKDISKAIFWQEKSAKSGFVKAQNMLGNIYEEEEGFIDSSKAFYWYEQAAKQNDPEGLGNLGGCYLEGIGTTINVPKGLELYNKAAKMGDVVSQVCLGNYYYTGQYVSQDYSQAVYWFTKAANSHPVAQFLLGTCYEQGLGVTTDRSKAIELYKRAASQNLPAAQQRLKDLGY